MKKWLGFFVLLLSVILASWAIAQEIAVSNIATKPISEDSIGNVWVAIKASVTNNSTRSRNVMARLQAVDREGFELITVPLSGFIEAGQTASLTTKAPIPREQFEQIYEWRGR